MPSNVFELSTTGMPDILLLAIKLRASSRVLSDEIVTGSITMPVSNFLTFLTS